VIEMLKKRLASEKGFTLIELLVVIVILGILVAIAVPSYLSFRGNAQQAAAQANVRSAIPAAEGYYQDPAFGNGTYTGLDQAALAKQAPGVDPTVQVHVINGGKAYCLDDQNPATSTGKMAYYIGGDTTGDTAVTATNVSRVTTGALCATVAPS
jgi:type IV pilus assembly protein PilA